MQMDKVITLSIWTTQAAVTGVAEYAIDAASAEEMDDSILSQVPNDSLFEKLPLAVRFNDIGRTRPSALMSFP